MIHRDACAIEAGGEQVLARGGDFFLVGVDTKDDEFAAFGEFIGELPFVVAQDDAEALGDAGLLQDGLCCFRMCLVRREIIGFLHGDHVGCFFTEDINAARGGADDEMTLRDSQTPCFAVHRSFPDLLSSFGFDGDHFALTSRDHGFASDDQRGLMRRIQRPFHSGIGEGGELGFVLRDLVLLRLVCNAQRFVFCGDGCKLRLRRRKGRGVVLRLARSGFGRLELLGCGDRGMFFQIRADFGDGDFVAVADARAFGMFGAVHGDDFCAVGHIAHVAGEGHLSACEPGVARFLLLLIECEDVMLTHGIDLIVGQECLGAADGAPGISTPAGFGFDEEFSRFAIN